eukprot:TRINITY_DN62575_c0_g1_i1.p1 TRINITY_DN62575_c0_g1~~TRINITY_DN62575_c0_g1_i1.p1  ORF type:complete len:407 (+),score=80.99 TRINITY_DN62575_c0_g1_i1:191-1411(+)
MIRGVSIDDFVPPKDLAELTKLPQRPRALDGTLASVAQWHSGFVLESGGVSNSTFSRPGTSSGQRASSRPETRSNSRAAGTLRTARLLPISKHRHRTTGNGQQQSEATSTSSCAVSDTRGYVNLEQLLSVDWKCQQDLGEAAPEVTELPGSHRPASQQARDARRPVAFGRSLSPQPKKTPKSKKKHVEMRRQVIVDESPQPEPHPNSRTIHADLQQDVGNLLQFGFSEEWKAALCTVTGVDNDFVSSAMSRKREEDLWSARAELLPAEVVPGAYVRHQRPQVPDRVVEAREDLRQMQQESLRRDNAEQLRLMKNKTKDDVQKLEQPENLDEDEEQEDDEVFDDVNMSVITPSMMPQPRKRFGKRKTTTQLLAAEGKAQYEAWRQDVYSCAQRLAKHVGNFQLSSNW